MIIKNASKFEKKIDHQLPFVAKSWPLYVPGQFFFSDNGYNPCRYKLKPISSRVSPGSLFANSKLIIAGGKMPIEICEFDMDKLNCKEQKTAIDGKDYFLFKFTDEYLTQNCPGN